MEIKKSLISIQWFSVAVSPSSFKPELINFLFSDINQQNGIKQHLAQPREIEREQSSGREGMEGIVGRTRSYPGR